MGKQPFLMYFGAFVSGILFQEYLHLPASMAIACGGMLMFAFVLLLFRVFWIQKFKLLLYAIGFFGMALIFHQQHQIENRLPALEGKAVYVFSLEKEFNASPKYNKYKVRVETTSGNVNVLLMLPKDLPALDFAHRYRAGLWLHRTKSPDNDFQFNYAKYLGRQDIYYQGFAVGTVEASPGTSNSVSSLLRQQRFLVLKRIDRTRIPPKTKAFLKGIILADRTDFDEITVQDFQKSGLAHLIAISGTHIVIIFWMLSIVIRFVFGWRFRTFGIVFSLLLIWLFAVFIGMGNSVSRSCIMISVYYAYVLLQRKTDLLHALSLAGFLILLLDTRQIFEVGFQLSFLAVLGIYWLYTPLLRRLPKPHSYVQKIFFNTLALSFSAQIITLPLVLYYFHQFSWVSLPANLLIVPLAEIIIISSFIMTVILAVGLTHPLAERLYHDMINPVLNGIHWFAEQDYAMMEKVPMELPEVLIFLWMVFLLRKLLLKPGLKHLLRVVSVLAGFFILRLALSGVSFHKAEVLEVHNYKENSLIIKKNDVAEFHISTDMDVEKYRKYVVDPYLVSRRIRKYRLILKDFPANSNELKVQNQVYEPR